MHLAITALCLCAAAVAAAAAFAVPAQTPADDPGASGAPGAPAPAPETKPLERMAGTWDAEVEAMGQTSRGVETCRMGLGGFWLLADFEGEFMGAPFLGHGVTGWDATRGCYRGVWVDSMGSPLTVTESRFADDGSLVATVDGFDMTGAPARFRHETRFEGKDRRTFTITQLQPDGTETPQMTIRYTRRK